MTWTYIHTNPKSQKYSCMNRQVYLAKVGCVLTTAGTTLTDLLMTPSWSNRWSGTFTNPTLGSIVLIVVVDCCNSSIRIKIKSCN